MTNIISETYLGDAVYANFDGNLIALTLNDHRNPALLYLDYDTWKALKAYGEKVFEGSHRE